MICYVLNISRYFENLLTFSLIRGLQNSVSDKKS